MRLQIGAHWIICRRLVHASSLSKLKKDILVPKFTISSSEKANLINIVVSYSQVKFILMMPMSPLTSFGKIDKLLSCGERGPRSSFGLS